MATIKYDDGSWEVRHPDGKRTQLKPDAKGLHIHSLSADGKELVAPVYVEWRDIEDMRIVARVKAALTA